MAYGIRSGVQDGGGIGGSVRHGNLLRVEFKGNPNFVVPRAREFRARGRTLPDQDEIDLTPGGSGCYRSMMSVLLYSSTGSGGSRPVTTLSRLRSHALRKVDQNRGSRGINATCTG